MKKEEAIEFIKKVRMDYKRIKDPNFQPYFSMSISSLISSLVPEFDQEAVAEKTFLKNFNNPNSKYYQMTKEQIIAQWKESQEKSLRKGHFLDSFIDLIKKDCSSSSIEKFYLEHGVKPGDEYSQICLTFANLISSMKSVGYHLLDTEIPVFYDVAYNYKSENITLRIKGRIDALFWNSTNGRLVIIDWKTNNEIKGSNKFEKMLGPMKDYDNCELNKYTIQVYSYLSSLTNTYNPLYIDTSCFEEYIIQISPLHLSEGYKIFKPSMPYVKSFMDQLISYAFLVKQVEQSQEIKN